MSSIFEFDEFLSLLVYKRNYILEVTKSIYRLKKLEFQHIRSFKDFYWRFIIM